MRSKRGTGVAARRRLNRSQSWRTKTPSAAMIQSVKTIADAIVPPEVSALIPRLPSLQIRRALALVILLAACGASGGPLARIHSAGGTVDVALEVADTPDTRTRGLMYRNH